MNEQTPVDKKLAELRGDMKKLRTFMAWLKKHKELFEKLPFQPSFYNGQCDFDNLKHEEVLAVIKTFKTGKWQKIPADNARVNYVSEFDGVAVRCWQGEPPPNCRIVVEEIYVPASTQKVSRLVCQQGTLEHAAA